MMRKIKINKIQNKKTLKMTKIKTKNKISLVHHKKIKINDN